MTSLHGGAARVYLGDAREVLRSLPSECVDSVITSPPYWGLRDYGIAPSVWGGEPACEHQWQRHVKPAANGIINGAMQGETLSETSATRKPAVSAVCSICGAWRGCLGLEPTLQLFISHMVSVFREVRRVLKKTGTCWVNMGDSYAGSFGAPGGPSNLSLPTAAVYQDRSPTRNARAIGLKPKDRCMIPARVAIALQEDGWWLRDEIVWCLAQTTRVYARTQKGEQPMTIHDLVRLDPATVQLWNGEKWTQVLGWSASHCEKPVRLTLRSGETINCTPNHEWPTTRGLVRADELKLGDVLTGCQLPNAERMHGFDIDAELAWFAGLYLAEGCMSDDAIEIASHDKESTRFDRLALIAARFGGHLTLHESEGQSVNAVLHGSILRGVLGHFIAGKGAKDKHLHSRAWSAPNALLDSLLRGYLDGDGHRDDKSKRWRLGFCRNVKLADDLRTLCARLGYCLTLNPTFSWQGRAQRTRGRKQTLRLDNRNPSLRRSPLRHLPRKADRADDSGRVPARGRVPRSFPRLRHNDSGCDREWPAGLGVRDVARVRRARQTPDRGRYPFAFPRGARMTRIDEDEFLPCEPDRGCRGILIALVVTCVVIGIVRLAGWI